MTGRNLWLSLGGIALIGAGAYYYFSDRDIILKFSEPQLEQKLDEQMPFTKTYLGIFDVVLTEPRVDLVDGSDRVKAGVDVTLNIKLGGQSLPLGGTIDVSGGVEYRPEKAEFFLTNSVIEDIQIQGIPALYSKKASSVMTSAISYFYETRPIYVLDDSTAKNIATRLVLKDVDVHNEKLVVTLRLGDKTN